MEGLGEGRWEMQQSPAVESGLDPKHSRLATVGLEAAERRMMCIQRKILLAGA